MDRETLDNTLRLLTQRRPFQPFTVGMVKGDRLEVDFPNSIAFRDGTGLRGVPDDADRTVVTVE